MALTVDIGVFAHDEAEGIAAMVARLAAQDVLHTSGLAARVLILANGCTDGTAARATAAAGPGIEVVDLPEAGKSRTWNRFVHDLSRAEADVLIFCDADITFSTPDALSRLVGGLGARPGLWVLNSQPLKDIVVHPEGLRLLDQLIAAAGGGLDDWKTAVCGSLYVMPADRARRFHLPAGLPVEDGFLRAMVLTDTLTAPEDFTRIDGLAGAFHIYASERTIPALIRHQTRIIIGSAINAACFADIAALPGAHRAAALAAAGADPDWLSGVIRARLPRFPYGFVPFGLLTKRLARLAARPRNLLRPERVAVALMGFGFDLIVYLRAQGAMLRGHGAGFW
ncbi:glycosyltransferase [Mesorhizobium sp. AR10]|uniref:glycosyltransferase n=1 Tax=Mesorhizobium sp. AR10 TaxID=2865839 RepID=UPI0021607122|nr:glycosyltransferase [Mesorhizobium sp. AR10]UVK40241.1 glycosyltransferase [Mesorhizobium sp. AR10]